MRWRLAVAGRPIEHSLSPQLHARGLTLAGLRGESRRLDLGVDDVGRLHEMLVNSLDAVSITMPLKAPALALCDWVDPVATRLGVVNSLLTTQGRLLGTSTDGRGFVEALRWQFSLSPEELRVVVLGAGGAARAIVDALIEAGAAEVAVVGRSRENVEWFTSRYEGVTASHGGGYVDLVVNTTPAAARTGEDQLLGGVRSTTVAIDITYEPRMSPWRAAFERLGCRSANGLGMLAFQAALQMQWWWEQPIDGARLLEEIE